MPKAVVAAPPGETAEIDTRKEPYNIRMPGGMVTALSAEAKVVGRTFSDVVRIILRDAMIKSGFMCQTCFGATARAVRIVDAHSAPGFTCTDPRHSKRHRKPAEADVET